MGLYGDFGDRVIQDTKIEMKIHQNFLPRFPVLFMVPALSMRY